MAWNRTFLSMMADTCVVWQPADSTAPATDGSFYGITQLAASGSTYTCRYSSKRDQFRLADGGHVTQTGSLVIATTSTSSISPEARIVLSDGTSPAILSVEWPMDEDGTHHARVELGYRQGN